MVHWPKTVRGNLVALLLGVGAVALLVQAAVALSGPSVWALVAVITLTSAVLYTWSRRIHAMSDLALADAPSFGDALRRTNRGDTNEARELPRP
jgi:Flp pilus assembly protein TadB